MNSRHRRKRNHKWFKIEKLKEKQHRRFKAERKRREDLRASIEKDIFENPDLFLNTYKTEELIAIFYWNEKPGNTYNNPYK